ncbi:DUF3084 domain-containing protein [Pectinatus haikarae]|uniref:Uncharacterized protein (DUF3084 family) n=1 Tax=Pectinatus haikarae TaxID=349096 RepID=A0ABT9Y6C4_9FIRM|nr:DUF3084 domain-containing protein [Pectinatus haikarae]MDQ0203101.1 uncharacterized protein (DUF3084 family) [Pectinatus haikarae]
MYGIVLIVVLIIVGGLIAFIGDRLGSKVGKRKMSLFGLRPRHTSIIVTIVTGIAITTVTFGAMAVISKDVRTALFGMEKLQQRIKITQEDLNKADSDLDSAKQEQKHMQVNLEDTRNELVDAKIQTEKMKEHQAKLLADNAELENQNTDLSGQNIYLNATNNTLQLYNNELKSGNNILQEQNNDLVKRNGDLSSKRIVYQAGELIFGGVVPATTDRGAAQNGLAKLIAMANTRIAGTTDGGQADQAGIWIYPEEYENTITKISSVNKDMVVRLIAASNLVKGEPVRSNIELYPDKTVYQDGTMITSGEFVMDGSQNTAQQVLLGFLHDINTIASANGILPDPLRGSIGVISMDQLYSVTETMARVKGKIKLTAYSNGATNILGPLRLVLKVDDLDNNGN